MQKMAVLTRIHFPNVKIDKNLSLVVLHCTFTFGFFSHNFAISVKDKGLTNVKMYVERKAFSKGKI